MKYIRLRFSLKMMFVVFTVVAVAAFVLALPTLRAARFARFVRQGQIEQAEAMLSASVDADLNYRQAVRGGVATIQPLTLRQLIHGERRVIVGKGWGGGDAEFVVTRSSITAGANWFNYL